MIEAFWQESQRRSEEEGELDLDWRMEDGGVASMAPGENNWRQDRGLGIGRMIPVPFDHHLLTWPPQPDPTN